MRKITILAAMAAIATVLVSCGTARQQQTQQQTAYIPSPSRAEELKAEGWRATGPMAVFSLNELLNRYIDKIVDTERYVGLQGNGAGMEISDARMYALNDAAIQYATKAKSTVDGYMARQFGNVGEKNINAVVGAYVQKVAEFIIPAMTESFSLYKMEGNKCHVQIYLVIDEVKAAEARNDAVNSALADVKVGQDIANSIKESVKEMVNPNN